jgi:hypothetical protein
LQSMNISLQSMNDKLEAINVKLDTQNDAQHIKLDILIQSVQGMLSPASTLITSSPEVDVAAPTIEASIMPVIPLQAEEFRMIDWLP